MTLTTSQLPVASAQADLIPRQSTAASAARHINGPLRCMWYGPAHADTLIVVEEFLRTPAASAVLAEFYRIRPGCQAPECDASKLVDALGCFVSRLHCTARPAPK